MRLIPLIPLIPLVTLVALPAVVFAQTLAAQGGQAHLEPVSGISPLASHAASAPGQQASDPESGTALVKRYCATCHSDRGKAGGLSLASFDISQTVHERVVAERMIRKLRAGMMPPSGARRPEEASLAALAADLATRIDEAAANVSKGADVTRVNRGGQTTVDMANGPVQRVEPYPETIALLEGLGATNNHKCVSC